MAVTAPGETTLTAPSNRCAAAATMAVAASWSSITEKAGSASRLTGTAGRRSRRPSGLGTCGPTTGARRTAVTGTSAAAAACRPISSVVEERAAERRRSDRAGRTRRGGSPRPGGGRRRRSRSGRPRARATGIRRLRPSTPMAAECGPRRRVAGVGAGIGLPDREVHDHVGIEVADDADDLPAIPGLDPVERGRAQAASGWVDVEPGDLAGPALLLEQRGDERAELTPHAAHQDALSAGHRAVTVARHPYATASRRHRVMAWSSATQTGRLVVTVTGAIGPPPQPGEQSQVTAHSTPIVSWYGPRPGATSEECR